MADIRWWVVGIMLALPVPIVYGVTKGEWSWWFYAAMVAASFWGTRGVTKPALWRKPHG